MPKAKETAVGAYVRRQYPGLREENFQAYNNLVSKFRSRAKARDFDAGDLTQEQYDIISKDNLPKLEKGEKAPLDWNTSSMHDSMVKDGIRYLTDSNDYWNRLIVNGKPSDDGDTTINYLYVPSTVKYLARSIKYENDYLLNCAMLGDEYIDIMKKKLVEESTNADCNIIEDCPPIL